MRISLALLSLFAFSALLPSTVHAAVPATPAGLTVVGGVYTNDTTPTFTWDAVPGANHYDYKLNDDNYRGIGNATTFTVEKPMHDGWHTFTLRAQDGTGNNSNIATVTLELDTQGPDIAAITPATATVASALTLKTTTTGEAWTASCSLTVDGESMGPMHMNGQTFSRNHTFTTSGKHKAYATCVDGDDNTSVGSPTTIMVEASWQAGEGSLIKTADSAAVYYYGKDGMRHAFPNERIYWSWYDDYSSVNVVTSAFMQSLPLGKNVTFRPGSVLVRFDTDKSVYAVDKGTRLRKYASVYLTLLDYGNNWTSLFVTLPDVLRGNYKTGTDIDEAADYDRETAWDSVSGIVDLFPW